MDTLYCSDAASWRKWLEENGRSVSEIWLLYLKEHVAKACVTYRKSLEEALCCGWGDGRIRRIDEDSYARKFTPRTVRSMWSENNIELMRSLIEDGRAEPVAAEAFQQAMEANRVVRQPADPTLPPHLAEIIRADAAAGQAFDALRPSHRREYTRWIVDAKREETRKRRAQKAAEMLNEGERPRM